MPTAAAPESPRRLIFWTIAIASVAVVLLWALYQVTGVLLKVYISAILAIGLSPAVRLLERQHLLPVGTRRLPRWLAILLIYLAFLGTVVGIGMLVIPPLIEQMRELGRNTPHMIDRLQEFLLERRIIDHKFTWREAVQQAPDATSTLDTVYSALSGIVGGIFGLFTILILTFYLLIESDDVLTGFLQLFPRERRPRVAMICRQIAVKVSAWLVGQLMLGALIGASAGIALWLLGVPYFYVLALIAGVGELIPIVGPVLSAIPAMAVAFTVSPITALWVGLFWILQQQFESHVLVPRIMSTRVGVSAATVIVAIMTGGSLLGVVGVILAVPTAAILQVVFQEIVSGSGGEPLDSLPE